ncbi:hypothetical protein PsorP6_005374 [Peronosclerospora sorghi]|uniref:Uncharacterized protein n=1 Tax=Peronosclerospora sorghi TaxID=230839 RepID=A0ACC0W3C1_9STRA|nr:hypothetical protein PsorP6_005374 [Peronosclerospora sorghi]
MRAFSSSPKRQRHIWSTRVHREIEKCRAAGALPDGATLRCAQISETRGVCEGEFHCFVPFVDGSDALLLVPLTSLVIRMPFSDIRLDEGQLQYPFLAPEVEIHQGAIYLARELRERKVAKSEGDEPIFLLKLPLLQQWSPSTTLKMLLFQFFQLVQQNDPTPSKPSTQPNFGKLNRHRNEPLRDKKPLKMRKRDIRRAVYPCQEVDLSTSTLKPTSMLLQTGKITLLMLSREAANYRNDDYVYIEDLILLQDVVRITPQRGKSLTLFFKDRSLPCRTFLSHYTDEIVKDLRLMIKDMRASKQGRDQNGVNGVTGLASQLLPFLSTEQTEKAKEMSTKVMGKLGKVATSVTRFLRGDEDETTEQHEMDTLAKSFYEINLQKEAFYRTPSKARVRYLSSVCCRGSMHGQTMTEITRRYQNIAEKYAHLNNQEGHVERAISELQMFIEHPKTQRILIETSAYEQSTKGIRVRPA